MLSFHPDQALEHPNSQGLSNLYSQSLLNLRFLGMNLYRRANLDKPATRPLGIGIDVNLPIKWQEVVLTHGMKEISFSPPYYCQ